ncbi:hypothetical protein GE09DRAFT_551095 [Coniochaeta sp. 2T2.1]|nr:hypothetical protein GE09DRAFT_551095 [Coniochaeta sp. 2T2.1]
MLSGLLLLFPGNSSRCLARFKGGGPKLVQAEVVRVTQALSPWKSHDVCGEAMKRQLNQVLESLAERAGSSYPFRQSALHLA